MPLLRTFALFVWMRQEGEMSFSWIQNRSIQELRYCYEYRKVFHGKTATVFCFFNDHDLRDEELLKAAKSFMHGTYWLHEVDLGKGEVTTTKGVPQIDHPR